MHAISNQIDEVIIEYFNNASKKIWVNVTWFTHTDIFDALLSAKNRGLEVKLSIEDDPINDKSGIQYNLIIGQHSSLFTHHKDGYGKNHEKYAIIDDAILIFGSFNYTYNAANNSLESVIVFTRDDSAVDAIIDSYKSRFIALGTNPNITEHEYEKIEQSLSLNNDFFKMEILLLEAELSAITVQCLEYKEFYGWLLNKFQIDLAELLLQKNELNEQLALLRSRLTKQESDIFEYEQLKAEHAATQKKIEELKQNPLQQDFESNDEIKKYYLEAIRLAHPDKYINDEMLYAKANAITQKLNVAREENDIETVKEILSDLKSGFAFFTNYMTEAQSDKLQQIIERLKLKIATTKVELELLKTNELYRFYVNKNNIDAHIADLKLNLQSEVYGIKEEIRKYKNYE